MNAPETESPAKPEWNFRTLFGMIIGACILVWCTRQAWLTAMFLSHAQHATGVIVSAEGHPTIRFETARGQRIEFVQNGGVSRPAGTELPVLYDANAPAATARAATFFALWGDALWGLPSGLGFLILPLFGARLETRGRFGNRLGRKE
jgi:hypothetical protein